MSKYMLVSLFAATLLLTGHAVSAKPESNTTTYTLSTCPVSDQKLGSMGDPVVKEIGGREVRFCCGGCVAKYKAGRAVYEQKVDAQIIEQQRASYPLDTCVVSSGRLGAMGDPVDYVHGNRLVRFCCENCIEKFKANPDQYVAKLDEAILAKQGPVYAATACPVSGEKLDESAVDLVIGSRLLRLCCKRCADAVAREPHKYLE